MKKKAGSLLFGVRFSALGGAHGERTNCLPPNSTQIRHPRSTRRKPRNSNSWAIRRMLVLCVLYAGRIGAYAWAPRTSRLVESPWCARARAQVVLQRAAAPKARESGHALTVPKLRSSHKRVRCRPRFEALGRLLKRRRPPFSGVLRRQCPNQSKSGRPSASNCVPGGDRHPSCTQLVP